MTHTSLPVVVGIDGSEHSDRAVRFAVAEARRRNAPITLVNAVHETAPMATMLPLASVEAFLDAGRRLVDSAERMVRELDPEIEVRSSVRGGSRVAVLVEEGADASVIVLGHRARHGIGRVFASSTTTGVAARAHCPVISVPDTWTAERDFGRVVVGVDESNASQDALLTGLKEARRRGSSLLALHAWRLPTGYYDVAIAAEEAEEWMRGARKELETTLAPFREAFPDVAVEAEVRHEYPGPALLHATEEADLIVVGRRGPGAPLAFYLGSLARLLIREGHCPVEIVPRSKGRDEERLEAADAEEAVEA